MGEGLHVEEGDLAVEVMIEEGDTIVVSLLEVVTVEVIVVDQEDTHHIKLSKVVAGL